VRAVAESAGLDWVPVVSEPFELALDPASGLAAEPLLAALAQSAIQARLGAMPGYDLTMTGESRIAA
jgi:hypothetical protein